MHAIIILRGSRTCLQVSVTQDSLQSFLKVAEKLKIKGLCETLAPPPPAPPLTTHVPLPPPTVLAAATPTRKELIMNQG